MIKGINKQILEVTNTESPYFEKIIFFVKSDCTNKSEGFLKEQAERISKQRLKPPKSRKTTKQKLSLLGFFLLSAGAGVGMSIIMSLLVQAS